MKNSAVFLLFVTVLLSACVLVQPQPTGVPTGESTASALLSPEAEATELHTQIPLNATWQIQYQGEMDYSLEVDVYNLDLFDTDPAVIAELRDRGVFVMCYFSGGSYEDWRVDAGQFPSDVLGSAMEGWEGEIWLDIRRIDLLSPIMEARLDLAVEKECDGVDPDNLNGYENETGFPLTGTDQAAFNIYLSTEAHARGLSIGLKNDLGQIPEMVPYFDWVINEQCFFYEECHLLLPFIESGKPVFVIEYDLAPEEFCTQARELNFNALHKNLELDAYLVSCNG